MTKHEYPANQPELSTENVEQPLAENPSLTARARRRLGKLMGRTTVQVGQPPTPAQPEKRVAKPEQVEAALARLRATVRPAVDDITQHASPGSLSKSKKGTFVHERQWNGEGEYPGRLLVRDVTVAAGDYNPRHITDETSADAPLGVQVAVMHSRIPRKLQDSKGRVTPELVLMDDGRTFYLFDDGTPFSQHLPLDNLTPADAMSIIETVESGLEEHRIRP